MLEMVGNTTVGEFNFVCKIWVGSCLEPSFKFMFEKSLPQESNKRLK